MPARKGLLAPQNTFLDTIATRFDGTHSNFVLGNAKIQLKPIVYCSDGFCDLTGYSRAHIMQKSCACNFLYGPKTEVHHKESISRALEEKQELKLEVILYKSTKTPFWCLLDIVPIQDEKHEVVLFLCSHKDITKQKLHQEKELELARLKRELRQQHQDEQLDEVSATAAASPRDSNQTERDEREIRDAEDPQRAQQLDALASQHALMSMDEFQVEDTGSEEEEEEADNYGDHDKHTASLYSRRRSRAVLYQLSGHYGAGNRRNVNMKSKLKLNNRMNIPEYKTTTIEKQRFLLSHYGMGKSCWDWLILAVSFYVAIVVPYNATFKDKQQDLRGECKSDRIDIVVELVFLIDVILNFRTTFVNRKGEVVTEPRSICRHYIRGWFVVDACAALPFDLLCALNLYSRSRLDLNLVKLIRLLRLARLLQKMDRYSQYSYIILTLLMLIFSLLAHWCACIWYVIAMQEIEGNPPEWRIGWIHQLSDKLGYNVVNTTDMASSYVTALYFTTSSLTSVGFGNVSANTNAEKIFSIVIMLIGALMHAVVFGNVTALIRVMYARRSNYQTRLRDLKDFFRLHQLPKELQQRMSDYFQTTWSLNHGIETYEILKDFPEELRGDVSLHLHREVLSLPIFETAPQGFLKSLARHIESKFCCPTEYLIHRRDALNYLYLVCNGSMEVLQDNMVVAILGKGDLVGYDVNADQTPEQTLYGLQKLATSSCGGLVKSSSDLKALTYCDLKCIQICGLLEVLKLYPEFSDTFHREIVHDLSFNLREHQEEHQEETDDELAEPLEKGNLGQQLAVHSNALGQQVYTTLATSGDHQIGRYDHEDEFTEEEVDEEEEEGEEGEEEEEEEEEGDDDDGAGSGSAAQVRPNKGASSSDGDSNNENNWPDNGERPDSSQSSPASNAHNNPVEPVEGLSKSDSFQDKLRKSSMAKGPKGANEDWHSCDGLISSPTNVGGRGGVGRVASNSEGAPTPRPQLKPAIGQRSREPRPSRPPQLSFDLSRNTTAVFDRRRRSAGCIPRPLLVGGSSANQARRSRGQSSSLIHISEDAETSRQAPTRRRSPATGAAAAAAPGELRNIEARISGIAVGVRELKLELRQELNQFRQLLMQLLEVRGESAGAAPGGRPAADGDNLLARSRSAEPTQHHHRKRPAANEEPAANARAKSIKSEPDESSDSTTCAASSESAPGPEVAASTNLEAPTTSSNLHSDNDSGRSSASVHLAAASPQPPPVAQHRPAAATSGGRQAKVLLRMDRGGDDAYAIDIKDAREP